MTISKVRRARKTRSGCCGPIRAGDLYIEHTGFPNADNAYADFAGHPVRMSECRSCAERYGRGHMFTAYLAGSGEVS